MNLIKNNVAQDSFGTKSGKLPNSGKEYFLRLAADVVRDVNKQKYSDGLSYVHKTMIRWGLELNVNGLWKVK